MKLIEKEGGLHEREVSQERGFENWGFKGDCERDRFREREF